MNGRYGTLWLVIRSDPTKGGDVMDSLAVAMLALMFLALGMAQAHSDPNPEPEPSLIKTASDLQYQDLKVGAGNAAKAGDTVEVHYTGWLKDKTKFDSSLDRNTPFSFKLGAGVVIKGWDEGVAGMKVGGKRKLLIPAKLGYGARGAGGVIPPDAELIFEVELLKIGK